MEAIAEDQPSNQSVPYINVGFFALVEKELGVVWVVEIKGEF